MRMTKHRWRDRSAADLAVLAIVGIVGIVLILTSVAIVLLALIHPTQDTSSLVEAETEILGVLVGALVGFIGGRAAGRGEASTTPVAPAGEPPASEQPPTP